MPKQNKLVRRDLKLSEPHSKNFRGTYYALRLSLLSHGQGAKASCTISKKTAPLAVDRNKAKRVCRELLRAHIIRVKHPAAFVVRIHAAAIGAKHTDLSKEIASLMKEAIEYLK